MVFKYLVLLMLLFGCVEAQKSVNSVRDDSEASTVAPITFLDLNYVTAYRSPGNNKTSLKDFFFDPTDTSTYNFRYLIGVEGDGYLGQGHPDIASCSNGCSANINANNLGLMQCGDSQTTIAERIADCSQVNGADALWLSQDNGTGGEADWALVTVTAAGSRIWKNLRNQSIWSELRLLMPPLSWCQIMNDFTGATCAPLAGSTLGANACEEDSLLAEEKGNLGSANDVFWSVPRITDGFQMFIDGGHNVIDFSMATGNTPAGFLLSNEDSMDQENANFSFSFPPQSLAASGSKLIGAGSQPKDAPFASVICIGYERVD